MRMVFTHNKVSSNQSSLLRLGLSSDSWTGCGSQLLFATTKPVSDVELEILRSDPVEARIFEKQKAKLA